MDFQLLTSQFYEYSIHFKGYAPATIKRYKYVLSFYCRFTGIERLEDVSTDNIMALLFYGRTERSWSTNTFMVFYKSLFVFCKWCIAKRYMASNPMAGIEKPRIEKRLPYHLTKDDTLKLLEIVYHYPYPNRFYRARNYAIFSTFVFAGLRLHELLNLKYADVDLDNFTIFIHQGKGNKDRVVPISFSLAQRLKEYLDERKKLQRTCPQFFVSFRQNKGFSDSGMKRLVVMVRKASGLQFSVHKLRHTFATLMIEGGCDIYSLSKMMGHSDIKTTTIYLHSTIEHLKTQITKHPLNS